MTICHEGEYREVRYSSYRWRILSELRSRAKELMSIFVRYGYKPYVYGSVARGDVKKISDVDITFLHMVDPSIIETILSESGFYIHAKFIVMATPTYTPKAYLWLDLEGKEQISFFISNPQPRSVDFYKFGGLLDYNGLLNNLRVVGVDKRLMLIQPTNDGHIESCIIGREGEVAKILNVSQEVVLERVRKLSRRGEIGRTGVYLEYKLSPQESLTEAITYLRRTNKYFRRMTEERRV